MLRFWRSSFPVISITATAIAMLTATMAAQPVVVQAPVQVQTETSSTGQVITSRALSDFGAGGRLDLSTDSGTDVLTGIACDPDGNLRFEEIEKFSTVNGSKQMTEKLIWDFDPKGHLQLGVDYKYDLRGGLSSYDQTNYGLHGERTWELKTNYKLDGFDTGVWKSFTHSWTDEFTPYKTPGPSGSQTGKPVPQNQGVGTTGQVPLTPTNINVGVLVPRDYHPGDTVTGSLWPSSYAENFKGVPGLSEYSFPLQVYHLPDGSPEWPRIQIGLKDNGFASVLPNGEFSLHLPMDWKGSLKLQVRQMDPVAGYGPSTADFDVGNPVPAPDLPRTLFSGNSRAVLQQEASENLIDLWNEACDLKEELAREEAKTGTDYNPGIIDDIESDLDEVYDDIDEVLDYLPPSVVIKLAKGLIRENEEYLEELHGLSPTPDVLEEADECESWIRFLDNEIDYASWIGVTDAIYGIEPFWVNPVQSQGKLIGLHGPFSGNPYNTQVGIDGKPLWSLGSTPTSFYAMPPDGLTAGLHNYTFDSPGFGETALPVFYMTLTMWADSTSLSVKTNPSTTYHVALSGLNGLPSSAWSSSFFPSDLVSPSEQGAQAVASSLTGSITLSVTNESPGTIVMQNQFVTLNAQSFAPAGLYQLNGGVGAIADGGFSILGVARAYLQPQLGLGPTPGSTQMQTAADSNFGWGPKLDWNWKDPGPGASYKFNCLTNEFVPTDSTGSAAPTAQTASTDCEAAFFDRMYHEALGTPLTTEVGNPPATTDKEALEKQRQDAEKHVADRKKLLDDAVKEFSTIQDEDFEAYKAGMKDVPDDFAHASYEASLRVTKAQDAFDRALDKWVHNPTKENSQDEAQAKIELKTAENAEEAAERLVLDHFSKEHREAYEKAEKAKRSAGEHLRDMDGQLRDADRDLRALPPAASEIRTPIT